MDWKPTKQQKDDLLLVPADRYALFLQGSWPTTNSADEYIGVEFKHGMHTALLALHELDAIFRHPYLYE